MLAALAITPLAATAADCEKTVRWSEDPPHAFKMPDGRLGGIIPDEVNEVMARLGCTVRWVDMPWARALVELKVGRLDMLPGALRTPERDTFARFSLPGPRSDNVLFMSVAAQSTYRFTRLLDMRGTGFRLGAQIGVVYGQEFDELMSNPAFAATVQLVPNRRTLWLMLQAGRIDGVIADEHVGPTEIAQLGLQDKIKPTSIVLPDQGTSVAFSRATVSQEFVDRYNQALVSMHRDGSLTRIERRYGASR
jgi:polar amino acid transport system substrate-binding protein